ncbi:hypothetical protein ACWGJ9_09670 [Curtobacterium citreum]
MATRDTHGNIHARDGKFVEKQHAADEVTLAPTGAPQSPAQMRAEIARQGAEAFTRQVHAGIDRAADQLRQLADELEREKANVADQPVTAIGQVIRQVNVSVGNLSLHGLLDQANSIQQFKTAADEADLQHRADQLDTYANAIEAARDVEYDNAGDESRGTNGHVHYDFVALDAARQQYRGE